MNYEAATAPLEMAILVTVKNNTLLLARLKLCQEL